MRRDRDSATPGRTRPRLRLFFPRCVWFDWPRGISDAPPVRQPIPSVPSGPVRHLSRALLRRLSLARKLNALEAGSADDLDDAFAEPVARAIWRRERA